MNNCPKCGNPVQVGTSSCPICGTNLMPSQTQPSVESVKVSPVSEIPKVVESSVVPSPVVQPNNNASVAPTTLNSQLTKQPIVNQEVRKPIPQAPVIQPAIDKVVSNGEVQVSNVNSVPVNNGVQSPNILNDLPSQQPTINPVVNNEISNSVPNLPVSVELPQVQNPVPISPVQVASVPVPPKPQVQVEQPAINSQVPIQPVVNNTIPQVESVTRVVPNQDFRSPVVSSIPVPQIPLVEQTPSIPSIASTPPTPSISQMETPNPQVAQTTNSVDNAIPSMASMSLPTSGVELPTVNAPTTFQDLTQPNNKKEKKKLSLKINKKTLYICLVALVIIIIIFVFTKFINKQTPVIEAPKLVTKEVDTNGYRFNKVDGWYIVEDGKDIIVLNSKESVSIYLYNMNYSFSTVSNDNIETFLNNNGSYSDISIEDLQVGSKNAKIVSAKVNGLPVEYYYIEGGSALTIGASVVYKTEDDYNNFKEQVKDMLSSMSYANDSNKVLNKMSEFNTIYSNGQRIYTTYGTALNITIME